MDAIKEYATRTTADSNHRTYEEEGTTILMRQSGIGNVTNVQGILASKADINQTNINGFTALMFAAERGNLATVSLLVEEGADIGIANKYGHTALFIAAANKSPKTDVINYLISKSAPIYPSLGYRNDAEMSGKAFNNLAQINQRTMAYGAAQQNLDISMRSFLMASIMNSVYSNAARNIGAVGSGNLGGTATLGGGLVSLGIFKLRDRKVKRELSEYSDEPNGNSSELVEVVSIANGRYQKKASETSGWRDFVEDKYDSDYPLDFVLSKKENKKLGGRQRIGSRSNRERAISVGTMLKCYESNISGDELDKCVKWANEQLEYVDRAEQQAVTAWAQSR